MYNHASWSETIRDVDRLSSIVPGSVLGMIVA